MTTLMGCTSSVPRSTQARDHDVTPTLRWPTRVGSNVQRVAARGLPCGSDPNGDVRCWMWERPNELSAPMTATFFVENMIQVAQGPDLYRWPDITGDRERRRRTIVHPFRATGPFEVREFEWRSSWREAFDPLVAPAHLSISHVDQLGGCTAAEDHLAFQCWGYYWDGIRVFPQAHPSIDAPVKVRVHQEIPRLSCCSGCPRSEPHGCALMESGTVQCWGDGRVGQLGDGERKPRDYAVTVAGLHSAVDIAVGAHHSCAVLENGSVSCWGYNPDRQAVPQNDASVLLSATQVPGIDAATAIDAGDYHTCALLADGTARCWGTPWAFDHPRWSLRPIRLALERPIVQLALSARYTCALDDAGDLWCAGML
ncbi:MAG: hypothetical protein AAF411_08940 [Myxococcota bacterium]